MSKFGHLDSNISKINVKLEFSTFEICYMQNFVKIIKLTLFGPKCQIWEFKLKHFQKQMPNLKSTHSKYYTFKILLRSESQHFSIQNAKTWAFGLEI